MKIGMRNIKTAIAVLICILISKLFKMEYPFFVVIAAIVSMQNSVTGSYKVGRQRMLGTFIGALIGLICASIDPGNAIIASLGIILVIYFCNKLQWQQSTSIACVVFIAIMLNIGSKNPLLYSFNRLLDTFIGINVALIVNHFIYPFKYLEIIQKQSIELKNVIFQSLKEILYSGERVDLGSIKIGIDNLDEMLSAYSIEEKRKSDVDLIITNANKINSIAKNIIIHLNIIEKLYDEWGMDRSNAERLKEIYKLEFCFSEGKGNEISIIYNYHLSNIIDELNKLSR
jgi:uncharacterized membrane protein YgaE (UPF0421/DUF939 family)